MGLKGNILRDFVEACLEHGHCKADLSSLMRYGRLDDDKCEKAVVRWYVKKRVEDGHKDVDAMWMAANRYKCSYGYVRRCLFIYTDCNFNLKTKKDENLV